MSEGSDEYLALAVHPRERRVALHRGPDEFSYPIVFEGVVGDDLEVDGEFRRMWYTSFGWEWVVAEADSEAGGVIEQTVADLRNGEEFRAAFEAGLAELETLV